MVLCAEIGPGLALDETAHLRKGKSAACVSPQHAGVTGRVENCVTWVFTALVTAFGQAWVDFDVYMPDCWAKDPQRRNYFQNGEGRLRLDQCQARTWDALCRHTALP